MSTRRPRTTRCDAAELGPVGGPRAGPKHSVAEENVFDIRRGRACFGITLCILVVDLGPVDDGRGARLGG